MTPLIIEQLTKRYAPRLEALKGIDLRVEEGDFFALLGPNGAGKTTTIGIITSLVQKTSGRVFVCGHNIDTHPEAVKACLGVVPQEFNFSMFEKVINITVNQAGYYGLPRKMAFERAEHYLSRLGLWDKRKEMARALSGGMKRRLMIARALLHQPKILILDEPTAGVDIELRRSMWTFLKEINEQGTTIILTTHYLEEAEFLCKKVAIIDKGQIIENTTVKELLSRLNIETFLLDLQRPLAEPPTVESCEIKQIDEMTLEITVPKTLTMNAVFDQLTQRHIEVVSMRNKTNRLEELFIRLVHH